MPRHPEVRRATKTFSPPPYADPATSGLEVEVTSWMKPVTLRGGFAGKLDDDATNPETARRRYGLVMSPVRRELVRDQS